MAKRTRTIGLILAMALSCVVVVGLAWPAAPRYPALLERARPVKFTGMFPRNKSSYWWFTDSALVTLVRLKSQTRGSTVLVDARTGHATPYPLAYKQDPGEFAFCRLSPDRKWVLYTDWYLGTAAVMSLDHKTRPTRGKQLSYPQWMSGEGVWMPDSRRWVVFWADKRNLFAAVEDRSVPGISNWVPLGRRQEHWSVPMECLHWLGPLDADHVLAINPFSLGLVWRNPVPTRFTAISIRPGASSFHDYSVRLPDGMQALDVALSPNGNRLAWIVLVPPPDPPLLRFLSERLPLFRSMSKQGRIIQLCTSRLDGTDIKAIGSMPVGSTYGQDPPNDLRWLPGGTQLSFQCNDQLWTIAAQ